MKFFTFIAVLVTLVAILFITSPSPTEAQLLTELPGFPVIFTKEVRHDFLGKLFTNLFKNVDLVKITGSASKAKTIKNQIIGNLRSNLIDSQVKFSSLQEMERSFHVLMRTLLISVRDFGKGSGLVGDNLSKLVGGCRLNIEPEVKSYIGKLRATTCKNKNCENAIKKEVLKFLSL